jgi:hypothetical protein
VLDKRQAGHFRGGVKATENDLSAALNVVGIITAITQAGSRLGALSANITGRI